MLAPFANDLISLDSLGQSFRDIEISNLFTISYLIDRARMAQKFWGSHSYIIPQTEYIIYKYLRSRWDKIRIKWKLSKVCNESRAGEEKQEYNSTNLIK